MVFRHYTAEEHRTTPRRNLLTARQCTAFVVALVMSSTAVALSGSRTGKDLPAGTVELSGAGATFPAPLYKKWLEVYRTNHPQVLVSYDPIGSGDGVKQFLAGAVDFGARDAAMSDAEMADVSRGVQLVPAVAGSIVLAYNVDGLGGPLKLTREVYVDIFLGHIKAWDDPRIQQTNPNLKLPSMDIALVVRQNSSGTTYALTNPLSPLARSGATTVRAAAGSSSGPEMPWPPVATRVSLDASSSVAAPWVMSSMALPGGLDYRWHGWRTRPESLSSPMAAVAWRVCSTSRCRRTSGSSSLTPPGRIPTPW